MHFASGARWTIQIVLAILSLASARRENQTALSAELCTIEAEAQVAGGAPVDLLEAGMHLLLDDVAVAIEVKEAKRVVRVLAVLQDSLEIGAEELAVGEVAARRPPKVLGRMRRMLVELQLGHVLELHALAGIKAGVWLNPGTKG